MQFTHSLGQTVFVFWLALGQSFAQGVGADFCAHTQDGGSSPFAKDQVVNDAEIPTSGTFRALVVFFRFADDTSSQGCTSRAQGWSDPDSLPSVAEYLLSSAPTAPFADSRRCSRRRLKSRNARYPTIF